MIRRCVYCPEHHDFGEIEPLADKRPTHGMCDAAAVVVNAKLDELYGPEVAAKAEPLFFTPHIEETRRFLDGNTTTRI